MHILQHCSTIYLPFILCCALKNPSVSHVSEPWWALCERKVRHGSWFKDSQQALAGFLSCISVLFSIFFHSWAILWTTQIESWCWNPKCLSTPELWWLVRPMLESLFWKRSFFGKFSILFPLLRRTCYLLVEGLTASIQNHPLSLSPCASW